MIVKLENKVINEKFALQEYEGKVRDILYSDLEFVNKCAIPITLMLYKWGVFCINRLYDFGSSLGANVHLVFYDKRKESNVVSILEKNTILSKPLPPSKCEGFARKDCVVVYIPVNIEYCPFGFSTSMLDEKGDKTYNSEYIEEKTLEISNEYLKNIKESFVKVFLDENLDSSKMLKHYKDAIEAYKNLLPKQKYILKSKTKLSYYSKNVFEVLKHELTHVFDNQNIDNGQKNFYTTVGADNYTKDSSVDNNMVKIAANILYRLWSYTEFNAFQQTYSFPANVNNDIYKKRGNLLKNAKSKFTKNDLDIDFIGMPIRGGVQSLNDYLKWLSEILLKLSGNNSDEFWNIIKNIAVNGNFDSSRKEKMSKMSSSQFKTYFIKTTEKLIEKFKEKAIKNIASQNDYNNDIINIAKQIKDCIIDNLSKNEYSKNSSFNFVLSFDYYFKSDKQSFPVKMVFSAPPEKDMKEGKTLSKNDLYRETRVDLLCRPIKLNQKNIRVIDVFHDDSFYELYKELVSKKRKSYLEKIAVNLSDELVRVMNMLNKIRDDFSILVPPWER